MKTPTHAKFRSKCGIRSWMHLCGPLILALQIGCPIDPAIEGCPNDGSPVTASQFSACGGPAIVGKSDDSLLVATHSAEQLSEPHAFRLITRVHAIGLDGTTQQVYEFDFLPAGLASSQDYTAWLSADAKSVVVADHGSQETWTGFEIGENEYVWSLDVVENHMLIAIMTFDGESNSLIVVNLLDRNEVFRLEDNYYVWSLGKDWLAAAEDIGTSDTLAYSIRLFPLDGGDAINVTEKSEISVGLLALDQSSHSLYWTEEDATDDYSTVYPSRLMRWDYSTHEITVEDPEFDEGFSTIESPFDLLFKQFDAKEIIEADNEHVLGYHGSGWILNPELSYFVRTRDGAETSVYVVNLLDENQPTFPRLFRDRAVWIDPGAKKLMIFEPQTQGLSEIDLPQ